MKQHSFIFTPGTWQGQGNITFSMAEDILPFEMHWQIYSEEGGEIRFSQLVEVESFQEPLHNSFKIKELTPTDFLIELENHIIGKVVGKGLIGEKTIAWEFRAATGGFEGFEIYHLMEDGTYQMKAEFLGGEGLRTIISGSIKKI